MRLLKKILEKTGGLYYPQEYLCLAKEQFEEPLRAHLFSGGRYIKDITNGHVFAGYSPLVLAIPVFPGEAVPGPDIEILFTSSALSSNVIPRKKDAVARLSGRRIREEPVGNFQLQYFEGLQGHHHFVSRLQQGILSVNNRLSNKKKDNVFLPGNLYQQVQVAYSLPREIALVTVSDGSLFNLFPTDLHGPVTDEYYVDSLRHAGKACRQVLDSGRMLISSMDASAYRIVYALGKNHMQELRVKGDLPFGDSVSANWNLPVPAAAIGYRELELAGHFTHGIHRVMLFKTRSRRAFPATTGHLAHVHNLYASWRQRKGLPGNYLLR